MRVPHIVRIGALVLATTGFYTYVGQMVPQKEVQPPVDATIRSDMTSADMATIGRQIMEGKGLCLTCHTIGKTAGPFPVSRSRWRRCSRKEPRPGPQRCRVFGAIDVRADRVCRGGISSGHASRQQASNRPHRSGDSLRDRVPADAWRHADGHTPDEASLQQRRGRGTGGSTSRFSAEGLAVETSRASACGRTPGFRRSLGEGGRRS